MICQLGIYHLGGTPGAPRRVPLRFENACQVEARRGVPGCDLERLQQARLRSGKAPEVHVESGQAYEGVPVVGLRLDDRLVLAGRLVGAPASASSFARSSASSSSPTRTS